MSEIVHGARVIGLSSGMGLPDGILPGTLAYRTFVQGRGLARA
jgi:hypothetical protein